MKETIELNEQEQIVLESEVDSNIITITLLDPELSIKMLLATFDGIRYSCPFPVNFNKFFKLAKKYPKIRRTLMRFKNQAIKDEKKDIHKTIVCFKRKFIIQVNKLKNII